MHLSDSTLILSATDLSKFLSCGSLTLLDRLTALGLQPKPPKYDDPALEALFARGHEHERAYLERLKAQGLSVTEIENVGGYATTADWTRLAAETTTAMRAGADVIYQGVLFDQPWLGKPDFLRRVEVPSDLGDWSYEVADTKLAREAKAGAVLQVTFYSDLLGRAQGREPDTMYLALGGPESPVAPFRYADFAAYYRSVRSRFLETLESAGDTADIAPDPCEHCQICQWKSRCDRERHDVDHLSLVAGISRKQRELLVDRGVDTLAALAQLALPIEPRLDGVSRVAGERIREQARIQLEGRLSGEPRYELLEPVTPGLGFCALPPPSPGDLFFDFEGDPHYRDEGLEYLFGWVNAEGTYSALWALDRAEERERFEEFVDFVVARRRQYPDLHVYHYAPYETVALKRLMGRHGTREQEVDQFLEEKVFVDLYRVVRQGLRASVESYSIKKMERFYGFERDVDLRKASLALANFQAWLAMEGKRETDPELVEQIRGYNEDDCVSTLRLRDWLEDRRQELMEQIDSEVPRPGLEEDRDQAKDPGEYEARVEATVAALMEDVPADVALRSDEQQARWLLAQLLNWHRREKKSTWWQYFTWLDMSDEELIEDRETLGGLEYFGVVDTIKRSLVHRFSFPRQEHSLKVGDTPKDPRSRTSAGTVKDIDEVTGTIDIKKGKRGEYVPPGALIPFVNIHDPDQRDSLLRIASAVIAHGFGDGNPYRSAIDLLLRHPPRVGQDLAAPVAPPNEPVLDAAIRLASALDRSVLPVQGPPGAGKTFTGARAIVALLRAGKRVGICATSHKVIGNLLDEVCLAGRESSYPVSGIQRADPEDRCDSAEIEIGSNDDVRVALAEGQLQLAAGTAWVWSREDMQGALDVLFIDEAGQFSLANSLAVAPAADSLVLLGDPRQLEQPQRGVHPAGAEASALDHLLNGEATIPPARGLFLPETWRLHPDITAFTSEMFYRGRLSHARGVEQQLVGPGASLEGAGLRWIPVEHAGNRNEAPEEAEVVRRIVHELLEAEPEWTDRKGETTRIGLADLLVIAPYNAQVAALKSVLPDGARVGTVDKFQGQEAPIALYSMTSSSPEDAPRGMKFLYSPNRLNVATSRAKCIAVVVASPALFAPECRSPVQMRWANAFCRLRERVERRGG